LDRIELKKYLKLNIRMTNCKRKLIKEIVERTTVFISFKLCIVCQSEQMDNKSPKTNGITPTNQVSSKIKKILNPS
jgi:hypothetical protein